MNYLITESQSNIVRRELKRSIEEIGFWKTKKRFRLTMDQMDNLLSGEYFPELDCENIYDIIWFSTAYIYTHILYILYIYDIIWFSAATSWGSISIAP